MKIKATGNDRPQALWPPGYLGSFPCPQLTKLVVSFPDLRDQVYDHLPSSLSSLSLRCYPHLYEQFSIAFHGFGEYPRYDVLFGASATLSLLRRCENLDLDRLEIEYLADDEEAALLEHVVAAFPQLTNLKIIRYSSTVQEQAAEQSVPLVGSAVRCAAKMMINSHRLLL